MEHLQGLKIQRDFPLLMEEKTVIRFLPTKVYDESIQILKQELKNPNLGTQIN
jgi:hypothetical protein